MRIKSEIYYQYYPLTDPRDLYKLEKIIFGPSWHEMASTEEVSLVSVLRQSKIILKWGYIPDRRKWMCRMSRLSREDQSWDCRDPEHAQNASELPKLPKWLRRMEIEPTGRSKRKRQAFAIGDFRTCVCGETADPQSENVIPCKQMGCESKWVSIY